MAAVDEVQVNVKLKDEEADCEDCGNEGEDDWAAGYDQGVIDGYCQATSEVLDRIGRSFEDPDSVRDLLFADLMECIDGTGNLHESLADYILGDKYHEDKPEADDGQPSAFDLTTRELGRRGEEAACRYLLRRDYQIVERNYRCPFGEVDIIARSDDGTVAFIEVKTRRGVGAGVPEEAVTPEKRARYERIAMCYIADANWMEDCPIRFDTIGIMVDSANHAMLRHHLGTFNGRR